MKEIEHINQLTQEIILTALDVHRASGPGLPEFAYQTSLSDSLAARGFKIEFDPPLTRAAEDAGCRIDLLVEDKVALEIRSIDHLTQDHQTLLTTCLVLSGYEVGLLINFNIDNLELGIKRVINSELYEL